MTTPARDLEDKTVLVTGASSGIGRATAVGLAARGARLLVQGRTPERCAEALAEIRAAARAPVELIQADLASLAGVRAMAEEVGRQTDALDVLVNNAGVTMVRRQTTSDGFERTFAVNHLAYFLGTGLLLPLLHAAPAGRIVNVASEAHRFGRLDLDDLDNEKRFSAMRVYGQSKTANLLFNLELARRLAGTRITTNALHPGAIRSNLGRGGGPLLDGLQRVIGLFMKSPEQGARTSIHLASSPDVEGTSGRYFIDCAERSPAAHARDPELARRLWVLSEERVGLAYP